MWVLLTSQYPEEEDHDECIAKVEQVGETTYDSGLVHKVVDREQEEVDGCSTCREGVRVRVMGEREGKPVEKKERHHQR